MKPIIRQYLALKREVSADTVLLFRVGPRYRTFDEHEENNLTIPVGRIGEEVSRLVGLGYTVALADYADTPRPGHLTRREVTRIFSPKKGVQ